MNSLKRIFAVAFCCLLALSVVPTPPIAAQDNAPVYDIVIRSGRVLDGAGNPWIAVDVAIKDGKFVRIGKIAGRGTREIDARGKYVSPGWIDMLDQSGSVLPRNGLAETKLRQGITTGIGGEGGTPVAAEKISEYFANLEKSGISINFGTYYNETQARVAILGNDAREPNPEELGRMKALMETAMKAGVVGMTTALIYPPSSYATTKELTEMAKVVGQHGGIYASHIRGEGKELIESIEEAIAIGEQGNLPVEVFHLKAAYQPGWGKLMLEAGQTIERARGRGVDVAADVYLYTAGGTGLDSVIPSWAHEGGREKLLERLKDPAIRARLKNEIKTGSPGWWNIFEAAGGWDNVVLAFAANKENARFEGKNLNQIAKEWNKEPADAAYDLVAQGSGGRVSAIYHMMSEQDIETALKFPWTSIGSDASAALDPNQIGPAHPRAHGNFPRLIAKYVRERKILTLPEAVRKMTSWAATRMRIPNRGAIKEGNWADVTIFDYDKIQDLATYEKPTLAPIGIECVLVNGQVAWENGKHTGAKSGQIIYGAGRQTQ